MKRKQRKGVLTAFLKVLHTNPMYYSEMSRWFYCYLRYNYNDPTIRPKDYQGYYGTTIRDLVHFKKYIAKGNDQRYYLTLLGLENINHPYAKIKQYD